MPPHAARNTRQAWVLGSGAEPSCCGGVHLPQKKWLAFLQEVKLPKIRKPAILFFAISDNAGPGWGEGGLPDWFGRLGVFGFDVGIFRAWAVGVFVVVVLLEY